VNTVYPNLVGQLPVADLVKIILKSLLKISSSALKDLFILKLNLKVFPGLMTIS